MKKLKNVQFWLAVISFGLLLGCGEEGGLKGTLKISITDAPIDADNVKAVNIVITNIEGYQNGKWKPFKNFEQPTGVNLLAYTGGKSILLIDQFLSPGEFSSLKLSLNIADPNSSLIVNPQSNVVFKNGTSLPLRMPEGQAPEIIIEKQLGISSRGLTDITLDVDLRKSIQINDQGEYVIVPYVRIVETNKSGHIIANIAKSAVPDRIIAYAYTEGAFSSTELAENSSGISFYNSITSAAVKSEFIGFGFLESGSYDLVFVKRDETGRSLKVIGRKNSIKVTAGERTEVEIDMEQLSPS